MLHNLKLVLTGRPDDSVLKLDPRLLDAQLVLQELQRELPKLEASLDENEKLWASLGHNVTTTAGALKSLYPATNTRMHVTLDALTSAGTHISKCRTHTPLSTDTVACRAELRAFFGAVESLRTTFAATIDAFRTRERYRSKIDVFLEAENGTRRRQTDREVARRIRNEQKLNQVGREADVLAEKLKDQVNQTLVKKSVVMNTVVMTFLKIQNAHLSGDRMSPVLAAFSATSTSGHKHSSHSQSSKNIFPNDLRCDKDAIEHHLSWMDDGSDGSDGEFMVEPYKFQNRESGRGPRYSVGFQDGGKSLGSSNRAGQMGRHTNFYPAAWHNDGADEYNDSKGNTGEVSSRKNSVKVRFPVVLQDGHKMDARDNNSYNRSATHGHAPRRSARQMDNIVPVNLEIAGDSHHEKIGSAVEGAPGDVYDDHVNHPNRADGSGSDETSRVASIGDLGLYPRPY